MEIKPAYSVSFRLSINIFVWQKVLYFPKDLRIYYTNPVVSVAAAAEIHLPFYCVLLHREGTLAVWQQNEMVCETVRR